MYYVKGRAWSGGRNRREVGRGIAARAEIAGSAVQAARQAARATPTGRSKVIVGIAGSKDTRRQLAGSREKKEKEAERA